MEKRIINFKASGQSLQRISGIVTAASDTVRYFEARFVLDESWEDFDSVRAIWVNGDTSSVRVLNHGVCEIPSEVLTEKNKLKVNLVGSTSEGGALIDRLTTFQCPVFGITAKVPIDSPNPPDIPASQVEQFAAIVRDDADRAEVAAEASEASAEASEQSASNSEASAQAAEASAVRSANSATNSADSATASANSASESASSATASANSATESHTYAQNASESAVSAENSAQESEASRVASRTAQEASETAQGLAEDARDEAVEAKDLVLGMRATAVTLEPDEPADADYEDGLLTLSIPQGIQGVQGDTGNGIASAVLNADYTLTLTFTNGTTYTTPSIRGEQGIQGDTGVGISSISKTSTSGLVDTYTITFTDGQTTTFTVTNGQAGATPNISIGTVTTLEPTEDATATISGTAEEPILSFGIPKGDTGEVSLSELEDATIVQTLSDNTPYNFRRTNNGNGSGTREYDEIVGASVGWNQLADVPATYTVNGITYTRNADGSATIDGTATASSYRGFSAKSVNGHVYYIDKGTDNNSIRFYNDGHGVVAGYSVRASIGRANAERGFYWSVPSGSVLANVRAIPQLVDLTLFNSAIADYVLSLETATAGSGVAWLKTHFPKLFDNGYQPFDSGSIKSVSGLTAHVMCDANDNIIGNYPLDSSVTLRGQYKLNDGSLYAVGDVWKSAGSIDRAWKEISLNGSSSEQWAKNTSTGGLSFFQITLSDSVVVANSDTEVRVICDKFVGVSGNKAIGDNASPYTVGIISSHRSLLSVPDSTASTANDFKAWLSQNPITIQYELATPTTENATPYTSPQWCDSHGTEEYVGSELPVGHNTDYPMSLVDTMPKDDGSYTVQVDVASGKPSVSWVMPASASMIAPTEASYVATRNYTSGSLLIVNGTLYKATANIANNGNIVPNTNCVATTLAEVISALA